jgi:DNA-binding GntR family transcriptional regulator
MHRIPTSRRAHTRYILAKEILRYVRQNRLARDGHLREMVLAEHFGVSRTVVRTALRFLESYGIVESRRNRGFFLRKSWEEIVAEPLAPPPTLEDSLYRAIVRDRVTGKLPARITQVALADRYRIDRGVLLRILGRMADEAIVTKNKGHGWTFLEAIDSDVAVRNSYDFRRVIEPHGILLPSFHVDLLELERIRDTHVVLLKEADDVPEVRLYEVDVDFHETIASFTNNVFFLQAVQQHNRLRRLLEYSGYMNRERVALWIKEHLSIIKDLRMGKIRQASTRMASHLESAHRATLLKKLAYPEM